LGTETFYSPPITPSQLLSGDNNICSIGSPYILSHIDVKRGFGGNFIKKLGVSPKLLLGRILHSFFEKN
jgi:hypothetical protein